jgi:hypothetical protein
LLQRIAKLLLLRVAIGSICLLVVACIYFYDLGLSRGIKQAASVSTAPSSKPSTPNPRPATEESERSLPKPVPKQTARNKAGVGGVWVGAGCFAPAGVASTAMSVYFLLKLGEPIHDRVIIGAVSNAVIGGTGQDMSGVFLFRNKDYEGTYTPDIPWHGLIKTEMEFRDWDGMRLTYYDDPENMIGFTNGDGVFYFSRLPSGFDLMTEAKSHPRECKPEEQK